VMRCHSNESEGCDDLEESRRVSQYRASQVEMALSAGWASLLDERGEEP